LADRFVKDPHEVVKTGDVVRVRVTEVNVARNRIGLTMRKDNDIIPPPKDNAADRTKPAARAKTVPPRPPQAKSPEPRAQGAFGSVLADALKRKQGKV
jgi:uncharacterized protein